VISCAVDLLCDNAEDPLKAVIAQSADAINPDFVIWNLSLDKSLEPVSGAHYPREKAPYK